MAADPRSVILFGLESRFGHDALETIESAGLTLHGCVASVHDGEVAGPYPNVLSIDAVRGSGRACLVPLLTPGRRAQRAEEALALGLTFRDPVVHAAAIVSPSARLAEGALVGPLAVISTHTQAGRHLIVNRAASVGHDCRIGDYCSIGPGASICGACEIEDGVFVGAGAVLGPKVRLGRNAVVGAGAVVVDDVAAGAVVVGNPARVLRSGAAGYRGVGV